MGFKNLNMAILVVMALLVIPGRAMADFPFLIIDNATVFEGNSGTKILKLPVHFLGTQDNTITGVVSAQPVGTFPPTGGTACGPGIDFIPFVNMPFTITPNEQDISVNITICGDTTIEQDETILVGLSQLNGVAGCNTDFCTAVGTIVNDDGPPSMSINNISLSTPLGLHRTVDFTVSLHHPSPSPVSVHFATRNGTASAASTTGIGGYFVTSGTLQFPVDPSTGTTALTATIPVQVTGNQSGTFFMDLSNPVGGTIFDGTGQCTIQVYRLTIGSFAISPQNARVPAETPVNYSLSWTVPPPEVWRNLKTIDLRFRKGNQIPLWLRWDEAANTFSLCQATDDGNTVCGPGASPGTATFLETPDAEVSLANTSVIGSGPTGPSVILNLGITFKGKAAGHLYDLEVAATDDLGNQDDFTPGTSVHVQQPLIK